MTRGAEAGLRARFFRVARSETGAMEATETHLVKREARRQSRNGAYAVARRARSFGVACGAQVARARRLGTVFTQPIPFVHEMTRRQRAFAFEVHVATVAIAGGPLLFVLVTRKAGGHLRPECLGALKGHLLMAPHAITLRGRHVLHVIESEMLTRDLCSASRGGIAVAAQAVPIAVRRGVATNTIVLGREMRRALLARSGHIGVALLAIDAVGDVRTMRKAGLRGSRTKPEHPGARGECEAQEEQDGTGCATHRTSQIREMRASALSSTSCSGVEAASVAAAISQALADLHESDTIPQGHALPRALG